MKIFRTIVWVLLLIALLIFSINNWNPVEVKIWEGLVLETKVPALVVVAFLIGLVPTWLIYRASRWNYDRRITSLETSARALATAPAPVAEPVPVAEHVPAIDPALAPAPVTTRDPLAPTDESSPRP
jgi:putative membrane protein